MYVVLLIFLCTTFVVVVVYFECLQRCWDNYYIHILEDFKEKTKDIPELEFPHVANAEKG